MHIDETKLSAAFALLAEALRPEKQEGEPAQETRPEPAPIAQTASIPMPDGVPTANVVSLGAQTMYGAPPATPATAPTEPTVSRETSVPTKDQLTLAAKKLWATTGDDSIVPDLLSRFGVTGLKALPEEHYAQFLQDIQEATNAG